MRVACISASNVVHAGANSTSLKAAGLIRDLLSGLNPYPPEFTIIKLVDYDLHPCTGCGKCLTFGLCQSDDSFNQIYRQLLDIDALFIVSAHYAPIPSKLSILLEKTEQLAFLPRFNDDRFRSPLFSKPVGIVAHGGGTANQMPHYRAMVLDTIANALSWPVEMRVIREPTSDVNGVVFPVSKVEKPTKGPFPMQVYDWDHVRQCIAPLVAAVVAAIDA